MNEYHKQAEDFPAKHNIKVTVKNGGLRIPRWDREGVEHHTAIFRFSRPGKPSVQFTLHLSRADTYVYVPLNNTGFGSRRTNTVKEWKRPPAYDILAGLEKYEPEVFDDWVKECGYDEVPKGVGLTAHYQATRATYNAVKREWKKVSRFFTPEEIRELQEIN